MGSDLKWTAEPWSIAYTSRRSRKPNIFGDAHEDEDHEGNPCLRLTTVCVVNVNDTCPEVAEANAARIVACVNGCRGLNTAAYRDVLAACKELLTAYGDLSNWYANSVGEQPCESQVESVARAAIQKAEAVT